MCVCVLGGGVYPLCDKDSFTGNLFSSLFLVKLRFVWITFINTLAASITVQQLWRYGDRWSPAKWLINWQTDWLAD